MSFIHIIQERQKAHANNLHKVVASNINTCIFEQNKTSKHHGINQAYSSWTINSQISGKTIFMWPCMPYLTYLFASQYLYINACSSYSSKHKP